MIRNVKLNRMQDTNETDIELTGEDNPTETELIEEESSSAEKLKSLKNKLKEAEAAKMEAMEELQRTKADFLNSKKRLEEQKGIEVARASDSFIETLLPVCDSFQMAIGNTTSWETVDETWRTGVEAIWNQLQSVLKQYNVTVVNPINENFDPNEHDAVGTDESAGASGEITQVLQYGYKRNDTIIRPAKVVIRS